MQKWKFYHNSQCSKSREALEFLNSQGLDIQVIEYRKTPLTKEELAELIQQLDTPVSTLVRVKEKEFSAAPFDTNSAEEVAKYLIKFPVLMERPILQGKGLAVIGRPLEKIMALLKI
jgi:arsenate reductase